MATNSPTDKQIKHALYLLEKRGYSVRYMDSRYRDFGATMRERQGRVEDWLRSRTSTECSALIDRLIGDH